eukprot:COSAG02_NODE_364_length_23758_cov_17.250011_11_plen_120_part_00
MGAVVRAVTRFDLLCFCFAFALLCFRIALLLLLLLLSLSLSLSLSLCFAFALLRLIVDDWANRMIAFLLPAVQIRTLHGLRHAAAASDAVVVVCLLVILVQLAISPTPVRRQLWTRRPH